ncbi:MAG: GNAT family N-acetyltransferase [Chromatiales bacterium]|jgi:ribosomal protein S18 acetylase RimI-like enzyme
MSNIHCYDKRHESELIALLSADPDWNLFTCEGNLDVFRHALLNSDTLICTCHGSICGYLRALVDGFGIYVSELYVAPGYRDSGNARELLRKIKQQHPNQDVYILSDEDRYYEKLGCMRVGSVFRL